MTDMSPAGDDCSGQGDSPPASKSEITEKFSKMEYSLIPNFVPSNFKEDHSMLKSSKENASTTDSFNNSVRRHGNFKAPKVDVTDCNWRDPAKNSYHQEFQMKRGVKHRMWEERTNYAYSKRDAVYRQPHYIINNEDSECSYSDVLPMGNYDQEEEVFSMNEADPNQENVFQLNYGATPPIRQQDYQNQFYYQQQAQPIFEKNNVFQPNMHPINENVNIPCQNYDPSHNYVFYNRMGNYNPEVVENEIDYSQLGHFVRAAQPKYIPQQQKDKQTFYQPNQENFWYQSIEPEGYSPNESIDETMEASHINIAREEFGPIIGKKGCKIQYFQEATGTVINIINEKKESGVLEIKGILKAREMAVSMIQAFLKRYHYQASIKTSESPYSDKYPTKENSNCFEDPQIDDSSSTTKNNFYKEDEKIAMMTNDEAFEFRSDNSNIIVNILDEDTDVKIPNPVASFEQAFQYFPEILAEINKQNFRKPFPIQCQGWPILLQGHDLIGIAQTGTGKTLTYLLPALIHIHSQSRTSHSKSGPISLILAPTRELVQQINREVMKINYKNIKCVCVYGGGSRRDQIDVCTSGVEIVIATPGRLNDLISNNFISMKSITFLILDEADRMLDMGFEPQIRKILQEIRSERQTVMTSATWPEGVRKLACQFMTKPLQVIIGSLDLKVVNSVTQKVIVTSPDDKMQELYKFLSTMSPKDKVIVFVDMKIIANEVSQELQCLGIRCQCIHGDKDQRNRERAIMDMCTGRVKILIATDVASRGLDFKDITHIFNYDFPKNKEEYVHRVGRTGRAGKTGESITLITKENRKQANDLVDILIRANQEVPKDLLKLANRYTGSKGKDERRPYGRQVKQY